ncbi:uncharacterized protein CIMG_11755 [Coccidioides immitis RS]|uniref:Uncharacterized protein n=4 Tax=Coccidioides immitis TaxID=5501 RepID=A0A0D8JWB3_COCIM|nr:uncharacterized protein CIMG_11755 [Coccidioides immitis RS]KJF60583.1 hypothetical protein CIMG_11755 [Coccidioides immitis RS]
MGWRRSESLGSALIRYLAESRANFPTRKAMKLRTKLSRLKGRLWRTGRNVKRCFIYCPRRTNSSSLEDRYQAGEAAQTEPYEALSFGEDNALPVIEPPSGFPSATDRSVETFRRLDHTYTCECRSLLLERLRLVMANSLIPVLEEFSSCCCGQDRFGGAPTDRSLSSGYDTISTRTLSLERHGGIRIELRNGMFGASLAACQNESLSCCEWGSSSSSSYPRPRALSEPLNDRVLVVRLPRGRAVCHRTASGQGECQGRNLSECSNCFTDQWHHRPAESVPAWINDLPDCPIPGITDPSILHRPLRRKRKMSDLCRQGS